MYEYTPLYKILFLIHPPLAFAAYAGFMVAFIGSIFYLTKRKQRYDTLTFIAIKSSFIVLTVAVLLGMLFSKLAWGSYWSWDPKQTVTFVTLMIYLAYLSLHSVLEGESQKLGGSAISIFGFISVIFTYVSTKYYMTLHPEGVGSIIFPVNGYLFGLFMLFIPVLYLLYLQKAYKKSLGRST